MLYPGRFILVESVRSAGKRAAVSKQEGFFNYPELFLCCLYSNKSEVKDSKVISLHFKPVPD